MWWVAGSKNLPALGKKMLSLPPIYTLSFPNIHTCFLHNPPSIPSSFTYIDWRHSIDLADISSWWKLHGFPSHLFHNYPPNKKVPKNDQIYKDKYPKFNSEFTLKKWVDWKTDPFPGLTLPPQHRSSNQHLGWKHKNGRSIFGYLYFVKAWVFAKLHLVVRTSQKAPWNWNIESERFTLPKCRISSESHLEVTYVLKWGVQWTESALAGLAESLLKSKHWRLRMVQGCKTWWKLLALNRRTRLHHQAEAALSSKVRKMFTVPSCLTSKCPSSQKKLARAGPGWVDIQKSSKVFVFLT